MDSAENGGKGKRKFEEESSIVNRESNAVVEEYDSDEYDHDLYAGGRRMTREMRHKYKKQVNESEGFDITLDLDLGVCISAPIVPARGMENKPRYTEISCLAIDHYNSQNNTNYKFVKNLTVNKSLAAGYWCRNTFLAKDSDAPNIEKTFQAFGFWGICGERIIEFCRLKKTSSREGRYWNTQRYFEVFGLFHNFDVKCITYFCYGDVKFLKVHVHVYTSSGCS